MATRFDFREQSDNNATIQMFIITTIPSINGNLVTRLIKPINSLTRSYLVVFKLIFLDVDSVINKTVTTEKTTFPSNKR